jgi:hypothetical protein
VEGGVVSKTARALTDEEDEAQERDRVAEELSRKMIKLLQGYTGDTAVIAVAKVLQHIVR